MAGVLVPAAITDIRSGKVFNYITYPAVVIGIIGHSLLGGRDLQGNTIGFSSSMMGFVIGFIPMFIAWKMGGIGGGDAKLTAAVGALGGWHFTIGCLFYSFGCTMLIALVVMLRYKILKRTVSRVWNFLMIVLLRGKPADPSEKTSPKIAFALAVLLGAILAALDSGFGWLVSKGL